jgi:hypothetical protein
MNVAMPCNPVIERDANVVFSDTSIGFAEKI